MCSTYARTSLKSEKGVVPSLKPDAVSASSFIWNINWKEFQFKALKVCRIHTRIQMKYAALRLEEDRDPQRESQRWCHLSKQAATWWQTKRTIPSQPAFKKKKKREKKMHWYKHWVSWQVSMEDQRPVSSPMSPVMADGRGIKGHKSSGIRWHVTPRLTVKGDILITARPSSPLQTFKLNFQSGTTAMENATLMLQFLYVNLMGFGPQDDFISGEKKCHKKLFVGEICLVGASWHYSE